MEDKYDFQRQLIVRDRRRNGNKRWAIIRNYAKPKIRRIEKEAKNSLGYVNDCRD